MRKIILHRISQVFENNKLFNIPKHIIKELEKTKLHSRYPRACPWHFNTIQASLDLNPGFLDILHIPGYSFHPDLWSRQSNRVTRR